MGTSSSSLKPACSNAEYGVVAGPFIGDPVTTLEICTAKDVRGDILIGQAGGHLRMYSETKGSLLNEADLMESGHGSDVEAHVRFIKQQPLPRTDGERSYISGHSVLSLIRDDNVHAIMGAYCDGTSAYAVARTMGGRVVPIRGNTDINHEEFHRFSVQDRYAARSATHYMQHQSSFVCLSGDRDGACINGKTGYEVEVRQPSDSHSSKTDHQGEEMDQPYEYGLKLDKKDIPVFFDGEYIVIMRTRSSASDPKQKIRNVKVYGGWGRVNDNQEEEEKEEEEGKQTGNNEDDGKEEKDKTEKEKKEKEDQDKDVSASSINIDLNDSNASIDSMSPSEIDPNEYDPTEGTFLAAELEFEMPPNRAVWGFTLSQDFIASVHQDHDIHLWHLWEEDGKYSNYRWSNFY